MKKLLLVLVFLVVCVSVCAVDVSVYSDGRVVEDGDGVSGVLFFGVSDSVGCGEWSLLLGDDVIGEGVGLDNFSFDTGLFENGVYEVSVVHGVVGGCGDFNDFFVEVDNPQVSSANFTFNDGGDDDLLLFGLVAIIIIAVAILLSLDGGR